MKIDLDTNPVDRYAEITLEKDSEFLRVNTDNGCVIISKDGSCTIVPTSASEAYRKEFQTAELQADTDTVTEEARAVLREFGLDF